MQWITKSLDWHERGIRIDGKLLSNFRFADDIFIASINASAAEEMLGDLIKAGKRIRLRIIRNMTQFKKNPWCEIEQIELDGSLITESSSYVYHGRSLIIGKNMELFRRSRVAWTAIGPLKETTDHLTDPELRVHLFDSMVLAGSPPIMRIVEGKRAKRTVDWTRRGCRRPPGLPPARWATCWWLTPRNELDMIFGSRIDTCRHHRARRIMEDYRARIKRMETMLEPAPRVKTDRSSIKYQANTS